MKKHLFFLISLILPIIFWSIAFLFFQKLIPNFSIPHSLLSLLLIIFISPVLEEIVFRGLIQDLCVKYLKNIWLTVLIVNLFFMLVHIHINNAPIYLVIIFISGVIFSLNKLIYQKIFPPIMLHFFYNLTFIIMLQIVRQY